LKSRIEQAGCAVAIDGPAGAGKSTVARAVAERTGCTYIDTGAMYRAVAYAAMRVGLEVGSDDEAIGRLAGELEFEFATCGGSRRVLVNGEDVSEVIRTPEVGALSSPVSAIALVREHLVAAQRRMAEAVPVVMEGRDIGTVVFPDARVKIFLVASAEERARRRHEEMLTKGETVSYEEVLAAQRERDERDSSRALAPLRAADDAVEIDSDKMSIEQVVDAVMALVDEMGEGA